MITTRIGSRSIPWLSILISLSMIGSTAWGAPRWRDGVDLQGDLGYQLKADASTVCSQCHGRKENKSFSVVYEKHVKDKKYDCSSCHTFSRPERGLAMGITRGDD